MTDLVTDRLPFPIGWFGVAVPVDCTTSFAAQSGGVISHSKQGSQ
ncbi:hypothetical protein [Shimia sp.]